MLSTGDCHDRADECLSAAEGCHDVRLAREWRLMAQEWRCAAGEGDEADGGQASGACADGAILA